MKHTTENQIKYWQSRLASAIEDKDTAEKKLRELWVAPAAPEQEDTKKKKRIDDAWEDLGSTLYDMGNDEPGW